MGSHGPSDLAISKKRFLTLFCGRQKLVMPTRASSRQSVGETNAQPPVSWGARRARSCLDLRIARIPSGTRRRSFTITAFRGLLLPFLVEFRGFRALAFIGASALVLRSKLVLMLCERSPGSTAFRIFR